MRSYGDTVTVIKYPKAKGILSMKSEHGIDCKIEGIVSMKLKPRFVKKSERL